MVSHEKTTVLFSNSEEVSECFSALSDFRQVADRWSGLGCNLNLIHKLRCVFFFNFSTRQLHITVVFLATLTRVLNCTAYLSIVLYFIALNKRKLIICSFICWYWHCCRKGSISGFLVCVLCCGWMSWPTYEFPSPWHVTSPWYFQTFSLPTSVQVWK